MPIRPFRDDDAPALAALFHAAVHRIARGQLMTMLYVEASEPARRFFERRVFSVEQRRDLIIGEVAIHNYRMTKQL